MGQSLARLLVHSVFSTKERRPFLRSEEIHTEIYAYIAGILRNLQCPSIIIGGAEDHIHILSSLSKNVALSELSSIYGLTGECGIEIDARFQR